MYLFFRLAADAVLPGAENGKDKAPAPIYIRHYSFKEEFLLHSSLKVQVPHPHPQPPFLFRLRTARRAAITAKAMIKIRIMSTVFMNQLFPPPDKFRTLKSHSDQMDDQSEKPGDRALPDHKQNRPFTAEFTAH